MKKKKSLRVPVTKGIKDIYAMDMRIAYQAACMGHFSVLFFARLAVAIAGIRTALEQKQTRNPDVIAKLDAAITTLQIVRSRGDETDVWEITESERPSVLEGIDAAEDCIGTLDVALLAQTGDMLFSILVNEHPG